MALTKSDLIRFAQEDRRILQLAEWVTTVLGNDLEFIEFASEDASFRRYFRVGYKNNSFIVMDSPVNSAEFEAFIRISIKFKEIGLNVPEVFAADYQSGFALITDFGKTTYLAKLSSSTANSLYEDAIDSIVRLQKSSFSDVEFLPPFSKELIHSEMELFRQWYLKKHLKMKIPAEANEVLDHAFGILCAKAQSQPKVWVHLDYHSRNLMVVENGNPGILDFQNAVYGPISYDLVSLLRDCYIVWDQDDIDQWIRLYLIKARQGDVKIELDEPQFKEWFDWMGVQRHIKVAGIFSRLYYRDQKPNYLSDIPRVMTYIKNVSKRYPHLRPLHDLVVQLPIS